MDLKEVEKMAGKPPVFSRGTHQMWPDPHISRFLLQAHLEPDWEAEILPPAPARVLDLGCGPGLYSLPLAEKGYDVLGMDISSRSLDYALKQAEGKRLNIEYREFDYRNLDFENFFDVILLIYCDLGALVNKDRDRVLQGIYKALKPGGLFVFDVFTPARRGKEAEGQAWEVTSEGFWSPNPHIVLSETFFYPEEDSFLDQHIIIEEGNEVKTYRIWDHVYTQKTLEPLLAENGFSSWDIFADIVGNSFSEESETIAVCARK